jgi:predicted ATPase
LDDFFPFPFQPQNGLGSNAQHHLVEQIWKQELQQDIQKKGGRKEKLQNKRKQKEKTYMNRICLRMFLLLVPNFPKVFSTKQKQKQKQEHKGKQAHMEEEEEEEEQRKETAADLSVCLCVFCV